MASNPSFEEVALKIADGIRDFAKKKRWGADDYRIFIVANPLFSRLRVTVLSKSFHDRSREREMRDYDDVSDDIDQRLGDDRDAVAYIGLILTDDEAYAKELAAPRNSSEFEIDVRPENEGLGRPRPEWLNSK